MAVSLVAFTPGRIRTASSPAPRSVSQRQVYDILAVIPGPAALEEVAVGQVTWFDGPRSAAQISAMRRAGEDRIQPVVDTFPATPRLMSCATQRTPRSS